MLSIANVCLSRVTGEREDAALWWAGALSARGHQVRTLVSGDSPLSQALRDRGLSQVTVPPRANRLDLRAPFKIRSFLKHHSINIVQVHGQEDLRAVFPAMMVGSGPRLFLIQSRLPREAAGRGALSGLIDKKLSGVIVPTGIGRRIMAASARLPEAKIAVIPPGFDPAAYESGAGNEMPGEMRAKVRARLELEEGDVVVGTAGRIEREKGQFELLEAARTVFRNHSALKLVIAGEPVTGEGGKLLDFMRARVREYHLDRIVKFVPSPSPAFPGSMAGLLSALDIFVMPSLEENFSGPLVEAMLSGLPCVGTESGGTPEILENGKAGLLAPAGSADGIARALTTLFETPELRGILGRRARESARERFNLDRVIKQIEDLYSGL